MAQDAEFSQFYNAQLNLNPAYTGIKFGPRLQINYRNQWPNIQNGFVTYSAAFDKALPKIHSGVGLLLLSDNMANGFYVTNSVYGCYSYALAIDRHHALNFGIKAGLFQHRIDLTHAVFLDQIDPLTFNGNLPPATHEYLPIGNTLTRFDVGAGMVYYSNKTYFGLALQHLTTPNESFTGQDDRANLPLKLTVNLGYEFNHRKHVHKNTFFGPNFLYVNQGGFQQFTYGFYCGVNQVFAGVWYRSAINNGDAIILSVGVKKDMLKIGYSFDATLSPLAKYTGGAHEISIGVDLTNSKKNKTNILKSRIKECPLIF